MLGWLLAIGGGGVLWYLKSQKADATATQMSAKVGDLVMARIANMSPPLLRAVDSTGGGALVSPPEMIPARIYGIQGPHVYARIDTSKSQAFAHNWDGNDVAFLVTDIDGIIQ